MAKANKITSTNDIQRVLDKISKGKPYRITNTTMRRDFDGKNVSLDELANVVASLIKDLTNKGILNG